jgi:ubiquitin-conjugating enzyme E2 J2
MECRHDVRFATVPPHALAHIDVSLTGLLSFMLSDEMTTGGVTSSDNDKKVYAAKSHAWNIEQRKFKEIFPDVCPPASTPRAGADTRLQHCAPQMRDLPNMGEADRGPSHKVKAASPPTPSAASSPAAPSSLPPTPASDGRALASPAPDPSWLRYLWERWRWGILILIAVVVSRLSRQQ